MKTTSQTIELHWKDRINIVFPSGAEIQAFVDDCEVDLIVIAPHKDQERAFKITSTAKLKEIGLE